MLLVAVATASHVYEKVVSNIRVFSGHTDSVNSVAFSPDGSEILSSRAQQIEQEEAS